MDRIEASDARDGEETAEEAKPEPEKASPYDSQVIARFRNLDDEGKKYLAGRLKASLTNRPLARRKAVPAWERQIDDDVQKIAPYKGHRASAPAAHRARIEVRDYLVKEGILPK